MKREKRAIYTVADRELFQDLVQKYSAILNSKKTDGFSLREKDRTWKKIEEEYNSVPFHDKRDVKQLKKLLDNIKQKKKQELQAQKMHSLTTVERPSTKQEPEEEGLFIVSSATEIERAADSNSILTQNTHNYDNKEEPVAFFEHLDDIEIDETTQVKSPSDTEDSRTHLSSTPVHFDEEINRLPPHIAITEEAMTAQYGRKARARINNARTELNERMKRVQGLMNQDRELHELIMLEQKHKTEYAALKVIQLQKEMEYQRRLFEADLRNKLSNGGTI